MKVMKINMSSWVISLWGTEEVRFKPRNNTKTKLSLGNMTITVSKFTEHSEWNGSVGAREIRKHRSKSLKPVTQEGKSENTRKEKARAGGR